MQIMRKSPHPDHLSAAGAAGVLGARRSLADEGPPEVTTIRLSQLSAASAAHRFDRG